MKKPFKIVLESVPSLDIAMTEIEKRFWDNEVFLSKAFSFERLGKQLLYLSICAEDFSKKPSSEISRKAKIVREKLLSKGGVDNRHENTLIHIQARQIIDLYLSSCSH